MVDGHLNSESNQKLILTNADLSVLLRIFQDASDNIVLHFKENRAYSKSTEDDYETCVLILHIFRLISELNDSYKSFLVDNDIVKLALGFNLYF